MSGGVGSRLQGVTQNRYPKALAMVKDKSLTYWCIKWLSDVGVNRVILATGFLSEIIEEELGNKLIVGDKEIELVYSVEKEKLGSGGAVKLATQYIKGDHCFVMNGDVLTNIPGKPMLEQYMQSNMLASMLLVKLKSRFGVVESENNIITKFVEKPTLPVFIHSGIDLISREIFARFPDKGQMEDTIFVELAEEGKFGAYHAPDGYFWEAVDTPKELKTANEKWLA